MSKTYVRRPVSPVTVVESSKDTKLSTNGQVSATWASHATCPSSCPLLEKGCYTLSGRPRFMMDRLNGAYSEKSPSDYSPETLAEMEADGIKSLSGQHPLRIHVAGDCKTIESARIISEAARIYHEKHDQPVWTYTHTEGIPREVWGDHVSVLKSTHTVEQTIEAMNQGYAAAQTVKEFQSDKPYEIAPGVVGVPCLHQVKKTPSCVDCSLCFKDKLLLRKRRVILFSAHSNGQKAVKEVSEL